MGMRSSFRRAAVPVILAGMLGFSPPISNDDWLHKAQPFNTENVKNAFNHRAFARQYALSCGQATWQRGLMVVTPHPNRTTFDFRGDGYGLAVFSPHLNDAQKAQAERMIREMPPHIYDIFYNRGGVFVFTKKSLIEALPHMKGTTDHKADNPYYSRYIGLYQTNLRRAYITFGVMDVRQQGDGTETLHHRLLFGSQEHTFYHEIGHFMDRKLGRIGRPLSSFSPNRRFSGSEAFVDAIERDMAAFMEAQRPKWLIDRLSHYLPAHYKGREVGGGHDRLESFQGEVFAELWAELHGHSRRNLRSHFPHAFAIVQEVDRILQETYESRPARDSCKPAPVPVS